jgi:Uma2 family endonuclease
MSIVLAQKQPKMTREEYLAFERASPDRHEFHDGELFPIEGATHEHSQIAVNLITILGAALRDHPCRVYGQDMRVRIPNKDRDKYPDLSIACPPRFEDDHKDTLLNPTVLFEILSPTTQDYDRGGKFEDYSTIPSLREYVLVAQDEVLVEHRTRHEDGWFLRKLRAGDTLRLPSIGVAIPLTDIYHRVFTP